MPKDNLRKWSLQAVIISLKRIRKVKRLENERRLWKTFRRIRPKEARRMESKRSKNSKFSE